MYSSNCAYSTSQFLFFIAATECRTFLLYYLPAVLHGILPDKYLAHAVLLSKAIRILLGECISLRDVELAEQLLLCFWQLTEKYYGQPKLQSCQQCCDCQVVCNVNIIPNLPFFSGLRNCTMNVHLLSHLPHFVRLFGPLWTHSAFTFEDCIGHLLQKSHSTHSIGNQVCKL